MNSKQFILSFDVAPNFQLKQLFFIIYFLIFFK